MNSGDPPSLVKLSAGGPPRGPERGDGLPVDRPVALTGGPGRDYSQHLRVWRNVQWLYNTCLRADPDGAALKAEHERGIEDEWFRMVAVLSDFNMPAEQENSVIFTGFLNHPMALYNEFLVKRMVRYPACAATAWEIFASRAIPYLKSKYEPEGHAAGVCHHLQDAAKFEAMTNDELDAVKDWLDGVYQACTYMSARVNTNVNPNRNYDEPDDY